MAKIRVAVLMGGRSAEREISLSSGGQVLRSLDPSRYEVVPVDTAWLGAGPPAGPRAAEAPAAAAPPAGARVLFGRRRPDVALICLHGRYGEDGTIQGMLELLGIPYTGSGVLASALAMDKRMAKTVFRAEGIPTPPAVAVRGRSQADAYRRDLEAGRARVACPAVVKPSRQGSTIGISIVREAADMAAALDLALSYDEDVLIEAFIAGVEVTAPVLGNEEPRCLPLVEIVPASGFYDYQAKYTPGATDEIVPARLAAEQARRAGGLAIRAHQALGCRGFSRTDMLVAADEVWVLEVNSIPGMTPTSLLPRSAEAAGIPFPRLLDEIIALALEGRPCAPPAARVPRAAGGD